MKRSIEIGAVFGRLTVIKRAERKIPRDILWDCKCECGNLVMIRGGHLKNGNTNSCGCLRSELMKTYNANKRLRPPANNLTS